MTSRAYAYYPGCSLHSTAKEYDVSARLVCEGLGIELYELDGWTCCGASSIHSASRLLSTALPARELQLAGRPGLPLAVACAMCYSRLKLAAHELSDGATKELVEEIVGGDLSGTVEVVHLLKVLDGEREAMPLKRSLSSLRVACYYGCLLVRPCGVLDFDDEENPQTMDRLIEALGARSIEWDFKTECCGASMPLSRPDIVLRLSYRILSQAKQLGADCIAVACPMCHSNLDTYQGKIRAKYKGNIELPVLYFTQLVGLALGFSPRQLLLNRHFTDPLPMLKARGLV
ncbi:MAG: CoB--CoM heterodisulfide reductase iron-sulfur subunit B family protein [Dehalococcoidia bacterium]|nr:CoB--CoM heterodisulfide reductase iron-sulfur subunit B family protein [Dehalococcoidia bacterium]